MGPLSSILLGVGLAALYAAQKIWSDGGAHTSLLWGSLGLLAGSLVLRVSEVGRGQGVERTAESKLLTSHVGVLVSLCFYAMTTEWGAGLLGAESDAKSVTLLAVTWPAIFVVSALTLLFTELAYRRMPVAEAIELRRLSSAAYDGMSIGLALVFAVSVNYAAEKRDIKKDVSYFKTATPSEGTLRMVKSVTDPVRAVLFFPKTNEVLGEVRPYFAALEKVSPTFKVEVMDHALAPALTGQHKVKDNGVVLLLKGPDGHGQLAEQLEVGTDLDLARSKLRTFDGRFQQTFTTLARQKREIFFTVGHNERSDNGYREAPIPERTSDIIKALDRANVKMKNLGLGQGLGQKVPDGAPAVAILGPRAPFLPEEITSLLNYVKSGGRLLVMVDPGDDTGLAPLLEGVGLELAAGVLVSDTKYRVRSNTLADRALVYTTKFSSHPTVTLASRHASDVASIFVQGGAINKKDGALPDGSKVMFPIRSEGSFWLDRNGNYELDGDEKRGVQNMMAAVSIPVAGAKAPEGSKEAPEGRVVLIADADFATDQVIRNPGNLVVINDILQWLLGQEEIVTQTSSEEDVAIEHTREEDKVWFYGTTLAAPLPLFALGAWVALQRRKRRTKARPAGQARAAGAPAAEAPAAEAPAAEAKEKQS